MFRSFRVRIALLSTLLSALVLAGFMTWAWAAVQRISLQSIDENIRDIGRRHLSMYLPPRNWPIVAEREAMRLGGNGEDSLILFVMDRGQDVLYISPDWPPEISTEDFPAPPGDEGADAQYPPPKRPGRRGPEGVEGGREFQGRHSGPEGPRFGAGGPPPPPPPILLASAFTRVARGTAWRIGVMTTPDLTFVLGLNMNRSNVEVRRLRNAFLVAAPAALILIALAGWLVAQRALRPVRVLTSTAERITAKGLDQRIPVTDEDSEFRRLVTVFNRMLDRLESSFHQAVRFSADAAHELKTPLTILQGELEQAIQEAPAGSDQQQTLGALQEEVQRLKNIIRKLLLLSLADSGELKLNLERVNLTEMLESACEDIAILAPELTVQRMIAVEQWTMADPDLLRQAIQNLVNNAIKYNETAGRIRLELSTERSVVKLTITNTGPGIPAADRARVFDRFYRADKVRSREKESAGLGLSLAREIARAHQGDVLLENSPPGETVFTLLLPSAGP
ncbi:MAG: HAMP domain-containing protein [Candidatus Hydrogenedentes bacterium]|nr:HAMP domain-containing protein [Candidatus Hydrogenedentota bacterium]